MVHERALTKSIGRRAAYARVAPRPAQIVGRKFHQPFRVSDNAADGLAERMTGKRRHAFEFAAKHRPIFRVGRFVLIGFERFADQSHSGGREPAEQGLTKYFSSELSVTIGTSEKFPKGFPGTKQVRRACS